MELAATQLARFKGKDLYLEQAAAFANKEPVTPWMGADTARHYQWYPFLNLGHYYLAKKQCNRPGEICGLPEIGPGGRIPTR
ncbi:hypothetical protein [Pontibacter oryzae]|uniref:hypothetical protein n=1 Tax=Pontibacter oryzae TaxID=2304593 RepID=UPI0018F5E572|nr:hypothetical protein [Pontibacter oryzae]